MMDEQLARYHEDARKGNQLIQVTNLLPMSALRAYLKSGMIPVDEIQKQETALDISEWVIETILQQGCFLTQGMCSQLSQFPSVSFTQPFLKTTVKDLAIATSMTDELVQQAIRAVSVKSSVYVIQPNTDKRIRFGQKTQQGMTFEIEQQDISGIIDALEPLIIGILGPHYPISVKTVVVQKLAELSRKNKKNAESQKSLDRRRQRRAQAAQLEIDRLAEPDVLSEVENESLQERISDEEQPVKETSPEGIPEIDLSPEIEADCPKRRVYHGVFKGGTPGNYQLKRDIPPSEPYNSDYYDNQRNKRYVNPYLMFRTIEGAFAQPPIALKGKEVVVRGEVFEEDPPINFYEDAQKVTKLEAYSVSILPIQSEQQEQIIRMVKKHHLYPDQIASKLHLSVAEVEKHIAAINLAFESISGQPGKKFL